MSLSRRRVLQVLGIGAIAPWASGCGESGVLRIGAHHWVGYEPLFLAQDFGWLPPEAVLVDTGGADKTIDGVRAGALDAVCLTLDEVIGLMGTLPLQVVAVMDISAGADRLMARPEIRKLEDLRGKRVAVESSNFGQLLLSQILQFASLREADVTVIAAPLAEQLSLWQAGRVDAALSYEPVAGQLAGAGAKSLFDSRQMPETIFDVLAIRTDRCSGRTRTLAAAIEAHFNALAHIRDNRVDAQHRLAARHGVRLAEANTALAGVTLPDAAHNRHLLGRDSRLRNIALHLAELLRRRGVAIPQLDGDRLFDARWLPRDL